MTTTHASSAAAATRTSRTERSLTCQALSGKQVLLTGTTGFLGKVLLESLLRNVPDIGGIHLLLRPSEGCADARRRYEQEVAGSPLFAGMRQETPQEYLKLAETRLHFVTGDMSTPHFGLSETDFSTLAERIDIVINAAASVNFREELDEALRINTYSLGTLAAFSHAGGGVPVVHVSTCYVSGFHGGIINELLLPPAQAFLHRYGDGHFEVKELLKRLDHDATQERQQHTGNPDLQRRALTELGSMEARRHGWNDTYTFTKWLGEQLLIGDMAGTPLTIVRPSIIESTLRSPVPGWVEGIKVSDAIILAYAREKISVFPADPDGVIDVVPVDMVANAILLCAGELLRQPQAAPRIYQACTSGSNPLKLGDFIEHVQAELRSNWQHYDRLCAHRPRQPFIPVQQRLFDGLLRGARLPLRLLDRARQGLGRVKPLKLLGNVETAIKLSEIYSFYTAPRCIYSSERLEQMAATLPAKDRELFPVDATAVKWPDYIRSVHLPGLQKYAVKPRTVASH